MDSEPDPEFRVKEGNLLILNKIPTSSLDGFWTFTSLSEGMIIII